MSAYLQGIVREIVVALRVRLAIRNNRPVRFRFGGRDFFVNPEVSARYHILHSTHKLDAMARLISPDARVILDVGANCGLFAALAADRAPEAMIHCFEPSAELVPVIEGNTVGQRVAIHNVAVGESEEKGIMYVNRNSQQTNSLRREAVAAFAGDDDIERREVDCISLDDFVKRSGIEKVDVLKVDVQGMEGAVFRGASGILGRVDQIFVESTWLDVDGMHSLLPFAIHYGFMHAAIVNSVYTGADLLLSRTEIPADKVILSFRIDEHLLESRWY